MRRRGFTLIEMVICLTIILIITTFSASAYIGVVKASRDNYHKEQTRITLTEYTNYYAMQDNLPWVIMDSTISQEYHKKDLYNDGTNTRFKTCFGPIDITSIALEKYENNGWINLLDFIATPSGAVTIAELCNKIRIKYNVLGWDYLKDRRFTYPNRDIILNYIKPEILFAVTDDGRDVLLSDIHVTNAGEGRLVMSNNPNQWITIYYRVPRYINIQFYRPDLSFSVINNNIVSFNNSCRDNIVKIKYLYKDSLGNTKSNNETLQVVNNKITLQYNPTTITFIRCMSLSGRATWKTEKYERYINYLMAVR